MTTDCSAPGVSAAPQRKLRARYLANLAALYRRDPRLAAEIDAMPFAEVPALEAARDGEATVRGRGADGKPVYLHSRYQPIDEANRFVAAQLQAADESAGEAPDGEPSGSCGTFVISGVGLGYHLLEFERRCERPLLIVAESNLGLLKAALCVSDLTGPLLDNRLWFLTSSGKAHVHERLMLCSTDMMLGFRHVGLPGALRVATDFHAEMRRQVGDFITFYRMQMMTLLRNARITCKNIAFNLPAYLSHSGIEVLAGRAKGLPAVLVAAGPSLARNIDQLGALREHAVVIAVQTVFKHLIARGTPPHFVVSLDFHEVSKQFFEGLDDVGDTLLVAEPKATWHVLDGYAGRKQVLHARLADDLLRETAPRRDGLKAGSTVAHLAFYLARHLGCDPIILLGQDLAFADGVYYPPGMPIEQVWEPELGRFQTIEMKQWERIVRGRPILRKVTDIHGREIYTDEQLFSYAEQFQSDFLASPARVIHACEAGMRLEGTEVMTLEDARRRFCDTRLPAGLFDAPPATKVDLRPAATAMERRIAEIGELKRIATEMSALLGKLHGLLHRPQEFNRVVGRVDELRTRIRDYDRTYRLVIEVSQTAELRRYSADRHLDRGDRQTAETARRRLRRDREFVEGFIEGCTYLEDILPQALARMREQKT